MTKYFETYAEAKEFMEKLEEKEIEYDYGKKTIMGKTTFYVEY